MLKALTAAVAITVCCLGNDYPAKAFGMTLEQYNNARQMEQLQQQLNHQRQQQQYRDATGGTRNYGSWN